VQVNEWTLLAHPAFAEPFLKLIDEVELLANKDPNNFIDHPKAKLLARIKELVLQEIPENSNSPEFEQGNTLGKDQRHWRRAKFLRRFRLFFRFSSKYKVIIYAWVNDENTLRKAGAATDPYAVFEKRLLSGNPPSNWEELLAQSHNLLPSKEPTKPKDKSKIKSTRSLKKAKR
jgi:toxin YhaV